MHLSGRTHETELDLLVEMPVTGTGQSRWLARDKQLEKIRVCILSRISSGSVLLVITQLPFRLFLYL
jgi:hypothetical protein